MLGFSEETSMANTKKVLIWVGAGCGTLLLLIVATCVGLGFWVKKKATEAGGPQAFAAGMMTTGINMGMAPAAVAALPVEEQEAARKVFEALTEKTKGFQEADVKDLGEAMERFGKAIENGQKASADDARAFVADCKTIVDRL
jgi:hypothetical protein